jgi:DNA repair photolyase
VGGLARWWSEYAIKPSSYVSGLCYSLLRGEPWTRCEFGCVYCYARWYRGPHGVPGAKPWWRRLWRRLLRAASGAWPAPWFRFSTLSEPLQPVGGGEPPGLVVWALLEAARAGVGVVLNTRSALAAHPAVLGVLQSLAERGLVVVQVSLSPLGVERLLEPGAPSVWERLDALEALVDHGVPVVARVQPAIPGLEERLLAAAVEALERGAAALVSEALRETREGLERLYRLLGLDPWGLVGWEPYELGRVEGREGLLHPAAWWRERLHRRLGLLAARYGAGYAPCKDGLLWDYALPGWEPGPWGDCCFYTRLGGAAGRGRVPLLRPTLHEYTWLTARLGRRPGWEEFMEWCQGRLAGWGYRCGWMLEELPGWLRRPLRLHENMMRRLVERPGKLAALLGRLGAGEEIVRLVGEA